MSNFLWNTRLGNGILGFIYSGAVIFPIILVYIFASKSAYPVFIPVGLAFAVIGGGLVYFVRGEGDVS